MINPVFQLACKIIREYKKKYFIIGIAIILTAVLFTTVISITVQVYQAEEISKQLAAGSDFHASISQISIDQVDKITSHSLVKEVFLLQWKQTFILMLPCLKQCSCSYCM